MTEPTAAKAPKVKIRIDEHTVRLKPGMHTIANLKQEVDPPIPQEHVLFQDADGPDLELPQDGTIEINEGLVLYSQGPDGAHPKDLVIVIDTVKVISPNLSVTESVLRNLVDPPIGSDRDLWREIDGAPDERIENDEVVTLTKGAEFYSVPREIAPGCD